MKERRFVCKKYEALPLFVDEQTQIRRPITPQPHFITENGKHSKYGWKGGIYSLDMYPNNSIMLEHCPYGKVGDILRVHEAFSAPRSTLGISTGDWACRIEDIWYWADGNPKSGDYTKPKSGIAMPSWASRTRLEITDVRIERLNNLSESDAWAEGCLGWDDDVTGGASGYSEYAKRWEAEYGKGSWDLNPWVWVISVKRITI